MANKIYGRVYLACQMKDSINAILDNDDEIW